MTCLPITSFFHERWASLRLHSPITAPTFLWMPHRQQFSLLRVARREGISTAAWRM